MAERMQHPFKNYSLDPDDIISPELKDELADFNNCLTVITKSVTEELADEDLLERIASCETSLLLSQGLDQIRDLDFISPDDAVIQIGQAMVVGFTNAVGNSLVVSDTVRVKVDVYIPDNNPNRTNFTLSAIDEDEDWFNN